MDSQNNQDQTQPKVPIDPISDTELKEVLGDCEPLNQADELEQPTSVVSVEQPTVPISDTPDELKHILGQFRKVSDKVLSNYESDREQIEDVIQFLDQMVQMGPKTPRVYVEMLVAALRTKAETNTNAVKVLDALAKLLSAGKGTNVFVNQGQSFDASDLRKLLDAPAYPDERG